MKPEPTVFIVDDDPGARDSLEYLITSAGLPVVSYPSAEAFLAAYDPQRPGCLVLDVRMPGASGTELYAELRARGDAPPVVFLTAYGNVRMATEAMKDGAVYFLEKPYKDDELLERVYEALERDRQRRAAEQRRRQIRALWDRCTPREKAVGKLVAAGQSNKQIARRLGVSEKTIEAHRKHLYAKMHVRSAVELMQALLPIGEAEPGDHVPPRGVTAEH